MALTLYVETNFIVGIAKGQDPEAAKFLKGDSRDVQIVIPSVCFMEAFSTWESEKKLLNQFSGQLSFRLREAKRNMFPRARLLAVHLTEAISESVYIFNESEVQLNDVLYRLSADARFIDLDADIVRDSISIKYINDSTDNLIFCGVLRDARSHPEEFKAFVSGNHHDFDQPPVQEALKAVGVEYFRRIDAALGWLRSQPPSSPNP